MIQEKVQLEFMHFEPDYETRSFVSSVAEKIHFNAPSDAAMKLALQKGKDAIQASCRIASQAGTFVAEAVSESPIRAVQQIERKIKDQLDAWKAWRFQNANSQNGI
ncbi:MAG TPA: hypothetical protein VM432_11770 [Bdellovibrionales bacterium]|jgi:hypothetical protein|nr:hypothetical protein [Bdellovibrionales bacterium]